LGTKLMGCNDDNLTGRPFHPISDIHNPPDFPESPQKPPPPLTHPPRSGSGIGPERALKAIKPTPRAKRESSSFPEPSCERRTGFAEPPKTAAERRGAHSKPQRSGIVPERALKAIKPTPRAKRESSSFPEPSCERRNGSAEPPQGRQGRTECPLLCKCEGPTPPRSGSGIGPERALKAIKPIPRAKRESPSFPEPSCERRNGSAEPY
jgi:hypothetical protein